MVSSIIKRFHKTLDDLKNCNVKMGVGIEVEKLYKQVKDQKTIETRWNLIVVIEPKVS